MPLLNNARVPLCAINDGLQPKETIAVELTTLYIPTLPPDCWAVVSGSTSQFLIGTLGFQRLRAVVPTHTPYLTSFSTQVVEHQLPFARETRGFYPVCVEVESTPPDESEASNP